MSFQTPNPQSATLNLTINQSANPTVATSIETMITKMGNNINTTLQPKVLQAIQSTNTAISDEQAQTYLSPLKIDIQYINQIGDDMANGIIQNILNIMTWITTLVTSVLLYFYIKKTDEKQPKSKNIKKMLYGGSIAILIGFTISIIVKYAFGLAIPFLDTAIFLSVASFCLMIFIVGVLNFTGIKGVALFALIMLLGNTSINLPFEFLPKFWQDWIYPWIPGRFVSGGLRDIFYFNQDILNSNTYAILIIGLIGLAIFVASLFLKKNKKAEQ